MVFRVTHGGDTLDQEILYSHLTLFKFLREDFSSVLDIGSHAGNVSNVLRFLGKQVINCEIAPGYDATYKADYLDVRLSAPVEAIWCSQVLEHQRNVGVFLDKVFDDLVDDGLLGLTVPMQLDMDLSFGHCNLFSPIIVIYQLVLAGFDCSAIRLKVYSGDICGLLRKRYNGIRRRVAMGSLPLTEQSAPSREILGDEIFEGMAAAFPPDLAVRHHTRWPSITEINSFVRASLGGRSLVMRMTFGSRRAPASYAWYSE